MTAPTSSAALATVPPATLVVARQAIFDRRRAIAGYELLFRTPGAQAANLSTSDERDAATSHVLSAAMGELGQATGDAGTAGVLFFVNVTRSFITGELPLLLGPAGVVLEVTEDIVVDDAVLAGLARLKDEGFALAVDDFAGEADRMALLPLADSVKLVLDPADPAALGELVELVRREAPAATIVVERIESAEQLVLCEELGADLFQGFWLQRPLVLSAPSLGSVRASALQLLAVLADPESSAKDIEKLVITDPALSLRILRVASSALVPTRYPITSLRQAIVLLGPRLLSSWATLAALGNDSASAAERATTAVVLARALACARLCPRTAGEAHTVGLLSGLADALGTSPAQLIDSLSLETAVRDALLWHSGPLGEALAAVLAPESTPQVAAVYAEVLREAVALTRTPLS